MGIGAALYPFDSLFQRPHLPQPESSDKFLGLGEGPVDDGTLGSGKLDTFAPRGFPISARSLWFGITPASDSLLALTITMNRIVMSPFDFGWSWIAGGLGRPILLSTLTSNEQ